jgi:hypothetical protein
MLIEKYVTKDKRWLFEAEIKMPSYLPGIGKGARRASVTDFGG